MLASAPVVDDLYGLALAACIGGGLYMEFGVANGQSLRVIRAKLPLHVRLYGFDSFKGLPERWNGMPEGSFATPYRVPLPNTKLIEGLFEETLPGFLREHPGHVSFMHIDCDLYSSTKTVLQAFSDRIVSGTVILFDEYFGYPDCETYERKAFEEFVQATGIRCEALARWNAYRVAFKLWR